MSDIVTLHVWRVPARRLPSVGWRLATDRRALRRLPGVRFAKLLGTADGFAPTGVDVTRWAAVLAWDDLQAAARFEESAPARRWQALATGYCRLDLRVLRSRGAWAAHQPFTETPQPAARDAPQPAARETPQPASGDATRPAARDAPQPPATQASQRPCAGTVLALTRARLRPRRAVAFWRAMRRPAHAVVRAPGLLAAFGIGEAPLGWQGTVSLWRDARDLVEFAYRNPDHRRVVDETPGRQWYAEELFARFAVVAVTGDHGVIGWCAEEDGSVQVSRSCQP